MIREFSVAVYPAIPFDEDKIKSYIQKAKRFGCTEIFSSAHLPELSFEDQLDCLNKLACIVKQEQLLLTVDLGGKILYDILQQDEWKQKIKNMHIDFLRLDYGYEPSLMIQISQELQILGFVWNASIMSQQEVKEHWQAIHHIPDVQIRACHNFYPRIETGLDAIFVQQQYAFFQEFDIPVTTCIASATHPRGPLHEGLPTIENHRYLTMEQSFLQLWKGHASDAVLIGDEFMSDEEFQTIDKLLKHVALDLHIHLYEDITTQEENLLMNRIHHIRYDSNSLLLRSQSSRQMAEFAEAIPIRETKPRKAYTVTMDNELYERYSGEVQIILSDLPADERVNVLGIIDEQDRWKLDYYQEGFDYQLIRK